MLKKRALGATLWSGAEVLLRQGLQFAVAVVLARLLGPTELGTVATLALFVGVATVLMDGGFSVALLQRQDVDHTDESTVFWCNLAIGTLTSVAFAAAAPAIADFYALPILRQLAPVFALTVLIASLGTIHSTLINKRLDFRLLIKVNGVATLASAATALLLAWRGYGVWALAAQSLVMAVVTTAMLWIVDGWRPRLVFSRASAHKLFAFGGYYLGSGLLEMVYSRLYSVLLGRWFGARELGYYSNADATRQIPAKLLAGVLLRAAFPLFAEAAHDPRKLRRGLQLSIRGVMLINAPLMFGGVVLAGPLVRVLFGEQWLPAAPILSVLCLAGVLYPLHALNLQALMAQGHARLMFRIELTKKALGLTLLLIGSLYGAMGVAWSQVIFSVVALGMNTHYSAKLLDYGLLAQARDFVPATAVAAAMAIIVAALSHIWHWPGHAALQVGALVCVGILVFFSVAALLRIEAFRDVGLLLRRSSDTMVVEEVASP